MRGSLASQWPKDFDERRARCQILDGPDGGVNRLQILPAHDASVQPNAGRSDALDSPDVGHEEILNRHFQHLQFGHSQTSPFFLMGNKLRDGTKFHNGKMRVTGSHGYERAKKFAGIRLTSSVINRDCHDDHVDREQDKQPGDHADGYQSVFHESSPGGSLSGRPATRRANAPFFLCERTPTGTRTTAAGVKSVRVGRTISARRA